MPPEKWPQNDDLYIDDEKYSEDWPSNQPPNAEDMASAHFSNEDGVETLIIKRQPKDKELLAKEKLVEFYDDKLNLPRGFNKPATQGMSEKYLEKKELPKSEKITWGNKHNESIKDPKAKRHLAIRKHKKATGKRI